MKKIKVSYVNYVNDREGVSDIKRGELLVSKFDVKVCVEEFYKNDEYYEYSEDSYDVYLNKNKDVMIVNDSCECYDNFVFIKES